MWQTKPDQQPSKWVGSAGAGGFDLRSDVMTTPTANMLAAIQNCSLLDDVFREDPTTLALEAHCAALTGKEAGLLMLSGTMGNQVALRTLLTQPPHSVLCDHRSHIVLYEAGGVSALTGATVRTVVPRNGLHLTLEDVQRHAVLDSDVHSCPTRVVSLENTLNGVTFGTGPNGEGGVLRHTHGLARDIARLWTDGGGHLLYPVHTNMCWVDLETTGVDAAEFEALGAAEGLRLHGGRLVVHYQIYENREAVVPRLTRVFAKALAGRRPSAVAGDGNGSSGGSADAADKPSGEPAASASMYPTT
ncbi:Pyridoxal phosphate-dependent transferase, major domain protein [Niveomyces insectorum RCEF 264]|uniref:Pyridoxal phosphate-dependent transferase, major domain protein n=1 Tax=Niveomyces insectorum RCEF 264 TaxID=1081102 RepID=A0A167VGU4_9HYPO|nr:Pyridoxal phosphate-dependent transferase, major domain protein [Niveomyces insectorum RCEF 264]